MPQRYTRRTIAAAGGFAAGIFASPLRRAVAQEATPAGGITPLGYVSTRLRSVESAEAHDTYVQLVREQFAPEVAGLEGLQAYLVANLIDDPTAHVSITVLAEETQFPAFREIATEFIDSVEETLVASVGTEEWAGDLLLASGPAATVAPASATPAAPTDGGYLTVRIHTSAPGTDPRDTVEVGSQEFIPIVSALPGFQGYLWYPTDTGFVAISLFDTPAEAEASTEAARDWMGATIGTYTVGEPQVINATVVYANTPIFA